MYRLLAIICIGLCATGCLSGTPEPSDNLKAVNAQETGTDDPITPTKPVVTILPGNPSAADNLNCLVTLPASAGSETILYAVAWSKDNSAQDDLTSATVSAEYVEAGSEWSCVVTASVSGVPDLKTDSDPASVQVQLAGPDAPGIEIQPTDPTDSDNLFCVVTQPSQGLGNSYFYQWKRDDADTPHTTPVLLANETLSNEAWQCIVTPFDADGLAGTPADQGVTISDSGN